LRRLAVIAVLCASTGCSFAFGRPAKLENACPAKVSAAMDGVIAAAALAALIYKAKTTPGGDGMHYPTSSQQAALTYGPLVAGFGLSAIYGFALIGGCAGATTG
jgi:hypothetical protein